MIEKSDLRELVFRLEHARKSLIGPKFRALGLPLGQGQPRILNSLLKKQHVTQKELVKKEEGINNNMAKKRDKKISCEGNG